MALRARSRHPLSNWLRRRVAVPDVVEEALGVRERQRMTCSPDQRRAQDLEGTSGARQSEVV